MTIPYRTRRILRRVLVTVLIAVLALGLIWGCWLLWLHKYVVFTGDGAKLDFQLPPLSDQGQLALPPEAGETVPIYYNEGDNAVNVSKELTQITGYYVEPDALLEDPNAVLSQIRALPSGTPIMLDVKDIYGSFYYSSSVTSARVSGVDVAAVDKLIETVNKSGAYTIARLPGLRDKAYGLEFDEDGVFHSSRGYLWMDDSGCYWLNPSREGTMTHLTQIVKELKGLGFSEVVFYDFCFPETTNIYFDGDQAQAVSNAAQTLVTTCADTGFAVSFVNSQGFTVPQGRTRLYVTGAVASEAPAVAQASGVQDPAVGLVFLTENHDTRFDVYSVLRPLSSAH